MNIYLIRHGRQCSALCNVNVDLSEEGHRQAVLTGERLKPYLIEGLYASHLTRAKQTAAHISDSLHLPVSYMDHIEEIHFGIWEGMSDTDINAKYGALKQAHYAGMEDVKYPDGENGQMCFARFQVGMDAILQDAKEKEYGNIAVVTHGMAMRAFLCGIFEIPFKKRGILAQSLENCSITQLSYDENKGYTLERFNDYAHLEPYDELLRKHFK